MATVFWTGNGQAIAQVDTLTVTAVAAAGTLTATINGKSVTYTCTGSDTVTTAATAWYALLTDSSTAPAEFQELTWANPSAGVVTGTATTPGVPFTMTKSDAGGSTCTLSHTTANSSPSDVGAAANWLRGGSPGIPQNGDDVIVANSDVSLLWNLTALVAVQFATFTRWQSFTGTIGLPENNPNGYYEYRPTYFQFVGPPAGTLTMLLGQGQEGQGPARERYDVGSQRTALTVLAAGSAVDDYAVRFLGTNANNTVSVLGTSVGIARLAGEVSTVASASVDGGGKLDLGAGVTFSGTLTVLRGIVVLGCAPAAVVVHGGTVTVEGVGLTYVAVTARGGSRVFWESNSTLTTLVLETGSVLEKGDDLRSMTLTNSTIDSDCQIRDPLNAITFTNATTLRGAVSSGPFLLGNGRTIKVG